MLDVGGGERHRPQLVMGEGEGMLDVGGGEGRGGEEGRVLDEGRGGGEGVG